MHQENTDNLKPKMKSTYLAVVIGVIVIGLAVFFTYSSDQAKIRGFNFGNSLQAIQDELKQIQTEFYSKKAMFDEGTIPREEFLEFSELHLQRMRDILGRYDELTPPESFANSVELFKISTKKQIESDRYLIEWIRTNDTSNKIRSDLLLQESFENEMAALASFTKAKNNAGQD
ncbi:MAG: hypothetical protein QXX85_03500 [Candidatus Nitrosotenuis sp.]